MLKTTKQGKGLMDSQKWSQRGKKLFLPKIEYNKLENSTTESWNTAKLNYDSSDESVVQETIENDDLEKSSSPAADLSDRNGISFTTFSVLPPIQGSKTSSKGKLPSHNTRQLSDCSVSGEEELYYKRKGSSLHRQTVVLTPGDREPINLQKTNTDNPLKIVGKRYSGLKNTRNHQQAMLAMDDRNRSRSGNLTSRPSTTPNAAHPFICGAKSSRPLSDSENDNGLTSSPGLIPQTDRSGARISGRRLSKFRRFNSDTSNEGKHESLEELHASKNPNHSLLSRANLPQANLLLNPSERYLGGNNKSGLNPNCPSPRPLSRCHIDINMNESENINLSLMEEDRTVPGNTSDHLFDTTLSADALSSAPLIQISTEQNSSTEERRESQNPPSIQILIKSLDSAKEEGLQDDKTEQPKLSVREQRRRSALCRANSKQVDDFLLVHNLRDLGLL